MNTNKIITIGREYGSGGRAIAQIVADKLGVKLYDKDLLSEIAKESGLCEEVLKSHDEKPVTSFFYSLANDVRNGFGNFNDIPINQKAFIASFETIQKIAEKESCVIVGRCSDYVLKDFPNVTNVFINADLEDKIELVTKLDGVTQNKAIDIIQKKDKDRANYYNYYSDRKWGAAATYDLCINSSHIGYEGAANAIIYFAEMKERLLQAENENL